VDQRISLVTVGVADLDRARRFYEALGWRRGNKDEGVVFFQMPGAVFALWSRASLAEDAHVADSGASFGGVALAYNARSKAEVDAVLAEAKAAGGTILKAAVDVFWGGYSGYFADPDGHVWEVAWNPRWTLDEEGRVSLSP
jgi:catechol 2,3-dioxygenase-like lactoylglutathione lyase family enzyme